MKSLPRGSSVRSTRLTLTHVSVSSSSQSMKLPRSTKPHAMNSKAKRCSHKRPTSHFPNQLSRRQRQKRSRQMTSKRIVTCKIRPHQSSRRSSNLRRLRRRFRQLNKLKAIIRYSASRTSSWALARSNCSVKVSPSTPTSPTNSNKAISSSTLKSNAITASSGRASSRLSVISLPKCRGCWMTGT